MAAGNSLQKLQEAGIPIDQLPDSQKQVLAELTNDEVETMIKIQKRMHDAADVQGFRASDNGIFNY
jgi:hypothetical protein